MLNLLKKIRCFSDLDDVSLRAVEGVTRVMTFAAGESLCQEGDTGDRMFIIDSGDMAVLKAVEGGDPIEVARLKRGNIAGEMGLFGTRIRSATLQAVTESAVRTLDYDAFEELLEEHGTIAKGMLSYVCGHLARETSIAARLMAKETEHGLRIAFFHAAPYRNALYQESNRYGYAMRFFTPG